MGLDSQFWTTSIQYKPEYEQGDESSVKGVEALLGSGGVLHHDPQQGGELAVQLVAVVSHLARG